MHKAPMAISDINHHHHSVVFLSMAVRVKQYEHRTIWRLLKALLLLFSSMGTSMRVMAPYVAQLCFFLKSLDHMGAQLT